MKACARGPACLWMREFESSRPSQPVRSPPLSAGVLGNPRGMPAFVGCLRASASRIGLRCRHPGPLSPRPIFGISLWAGACGIVCRRAESVSILLTDLATCGADQRRRAIMRPSLLGSRAAIVDLSPHHCHKGLQRCRCRDTHRGTRLSDADSTIPVLSDLRRDRAGRFPKESTRKQD